MTLNDLPGWISTIRKDGMMISEGKDTTDEGPRYTIIPPDARAIITRCPCCNKPLRTLMAAQLIANKLYPLPTEN
jgi:hypothetical protein